MQQTTATTGSIAITSAVSPTDHQTTTLTLSATVDGVQAPLSSFVMSITDPCSYAVFATTPSPLNTMLVTLASSTIQTQTFKIYTDIENLYPAIICSITATLTPSQPFITLASDFKTISIDEAVLTGLIPDSVKTHTFTLTVRS